MSEPIKSLLFSETLRDELKQLVREAMRDELGRSKSTNTEEKLLDPEEAAEMLSVSVDWLYHEAKKLPFARKLGPRMLRFSYTGMLRWMESKKFA